jgi:TolA-binding protein
MPDWFGKERAALKWAIYELQREASLEISQLEEQIQELKDYIAELEEQNAQLIEEIYER